MKAAKMNREQPSATAAITAAARGDHRLSDPPPWILDDPVALMLVGPSWPEVLQARRSAFGAQPALSQTRAGLALRSRYAEDRPSAGVSASTSSSARAWTPSCGGAPT
jgi:O-methyltransferase involved in polyketide biosynthesis